MDRSGLEDDIDLTGIEDDISAFQSDAHVRKALAEGVDLRQYSSQIEEQLKAAETFAVDQFVQNADCVADLFHEIKTCDSILESMETMLRGFQESLGGISSDIKKLQVESLSMNVKLKNRRAAERKLSLFINVVVISPDLVKGICTDPIDERYADHLVQLNAKIEYLRSPHPHPSLSETAEHVQTLTQKAVARIRQFLLQKIQALQKAKTNIQVRQQVLLKFKYFNEFLSEHAKPIALEVINFYSNAVSALLSSFFHGYIEDLRSIQLKRSGKKGAAPVADKTDLLCAELSKTGSLFGTKKTEQHLLSVLTLGQRGNVLIGPSFNPGFSNDNDQPLAWEDVWDSNLHLLVNSAASEYQYISEFFDNRNLFTPIFTKSIGLIQTELEQYLASSYDIIGVVLTVRVCDKHRKALLDRKSTTTMTFLDHMFDRFNLLIWPRFKILFDAHLASLTSFKANSSDCSVNSVHFLSRRFGALCHALVTLNSSPFKSDEIIRSSLSRIRNDFVSVLNQIASSLPTRDRLVFLINQLQHISFELKSVNGSDESVAFELLADQHVIAFAESILQSQEEFRRIVSYVKKADSSSNEVDPSDTMSIVKTFALRWRQGIDDLCNNLCNGQFTANGTENRWEDSILRRTLMHFLMYYQRFDEILRDPSLGSSPSLIEELVPIQTVVYQVKKKTDPTRH